MKNSLSSKTIACWLS